MHRFARPVLAALIGLGSALGATPMVQAADIGVYPDYAYSGVCAERWVLGKITSRFRHQVHPRAEPAQRRHHRFPEHPRESLPAGAGGSADRHAPIAARR